MIVRPKPHSTAALTVVDVASEQDCQSLMLPVKGRLQKTEEPRCRTRLSNQRTQATLMKVTESSMLRTFRNGLVSTVAVTFASCGGGGSAPASPPAAPNAPPVFTSASSASVRENAIGVVYRPAASDPEGATLTYTAAIGGPDLARFVMNPTTREIRFAQQPDFESPVDAGANNVYDISLSVSDGVNTTIRDVSIAVLNVVNGFRVRRIATALSGTLYAAGLPDGTGRVLIVQRDGRVVVLTPSSGAIAANDFLDLRGQVNLSGETGLLAIAFSPNFVVDRTFYVHVNPIGANTSEIRQYSVQPSLDIADATTANVILRVQQPFTNHKGGMLTFDKSGYLLLGLGDGGAAGDPMGNGQNTSSLLGKLLRIDVSTDSFPNDPERDYSIPASNPFASGGGAPEVWAMGLRNPFGGSVDPVTRDVFIGDVGQDVVEEIDRIPSNATGILNYGWNRREGTRPYNGGADDPSYLRPVAEYEHGIATDQGNSITGGVVYRGPIEDLQGQYIFGDFVSNNVWTIPAASLNHGSTLASSAFTNRNANFAPNAGTLSNITSFGTDLDGNVYVVTFQGDVFVLEPMP